MNNRYDSNSERENTRRSSRRHRADQEESRRGGLFNPVNREMESPRYANEDIDELNENVYPFRRGERDRFEEGERQWTNNPSGGRNQPQWYQGSGYERDNRSHFDQEQTSVAGESRGKFFGVGPKGYMRSDERIREEICDLLTDSHDIDASNIEIEVQGGEVTLTGFVESRDIKRMAEQAIDDVSGVKDVHNQLKVGQPQQSEQKSEQKSQGGSKRK